MTKISDALTYGLTLRESANDGSDFADPAADYRRLFLGEDGALHLRDSAGTVTNPAGGLLNKYDATTAPAVTDDSGDGYSVGSIWVDVTGDAAYICVDASVGAAVWNPFDAGGTVGPATFTSGGTTSSTGGYDYRAFTSGGTLVVATDGVVDLLLVGGGGGGGGYYSAAVVAVAGSCSRPMSMSRLTCPSSSAPADRRAERPM